MVEMMDYSIRPAAVELDEAVELPNHIQSPSQSKAIQDKLRKRQELREKFKEAFDELTDEELGIVHRGTQVGESKVRYKRAASSVNIGMANGIYSLITNNRTQQVAKETVSVSQGSSVRKMSTSLSRRNVRRIAPSDEDKLYEDTREDSTLQWTIPNDLYTDKLSDDEKLISGSGRKPHMTWLQVILYNLRITWKRYLSRKLERIPFLRTQIKKIEGNFGVGIASFFVFVRLVIALNIILAVLWTSFVVIPAASKYDSSKVVTADPMYHDHTNGFHVRNLFDGRGPVADSLLFYGGYVRESLCESSCVESSCESTSCVNSTGACEYSSCSYRIDIAYMIMIFVSLFGPFFILSWSYSESLSASGSTTSENELAPFSAMVLTSWDHSLVSSEAVGNLSKGITNTLKDKLTEYRNAEKKKIQTKRERVKLILRRAAAWLIAILLVAAATGGIVITILFGPNIREATEDGFFLVKALGEYFELYGTSVLFVIINALVPTLMFLLLPIEKYDSGKTEFNVTIMRVFVVRILNLYALMAGWKISTNCVCFGEEKEDKENCNLEESVVCAGTYYGQELYKVTLLSIAATIFGQLILRFGYFYWFNKKREFLIADAVLAVVYIQSVVWAGTVVCPFLPLIAAIGLLCLFFAYYYIVQYTCHPPIKRWSQSRQNSFFLFSLLAALVCVIIPVSIAVQTDHVPLGSVIVSDSRMSRGEGNKSTTSSGEGNNSFFHEGNNSTTLSGEGNNTLTLFGEGNYSLLFSSEDNNSLVFVGEGNYSVIFFTECNDSLLLSGKGNYSLMFSGEGLYNDSLILSSEDNDSLMFSSAGNNSLVFYGEDSDSLTFSSKGDYSLTFSGRSNDSLIFSCEDNDLLIFSGGFSGEDNVIFSGEDNVTFSGEGNHLLIFSIEGNYTLISSNGNSDTLDSDTASSCRSCNQNLYCGPFRNRTALFAILPDKASGGCGHCGVLCELFYVIFSSAIGLPLIFCLMVALLQFSIRLNRAKKKYYSLLRELEMERQKVKIVLKDYHRLDLKLKEQQKNQGHQNTDVASLARGTSRESL